MQNKGKTLIYICCVLTISRASKASLMACSKPILAFFALNKWEKNIIMRSQNSAFWQVCCLVGRLRGLSNRMFLRWIALTCTFSCELYRRVFSVHQTVSWVCRLPLDWTYGHQTTSPSAEMKTNHIISSLFQTSWDKNNRVLRSKKRRALTPEKNNSR